MADFRFKNDLMERALTGESMDRPPVWLMRQAGRTDPAYLKLKDECGMTLEEMFSHPEIAAKVSLLPMRLGIDAIIFFQDILTITTPMGAPFLFRPGPVLDDPIRSKEAVDKLKSFDVADELGFVPKTLQLVADELAGELPVLGFAGAPFTLAVFLIEGKSFGQDGATHTLKMSEEDPELLTYLVDRLTDVTIEYLLMQKEAGVLAVQLFESGAWLLNKEQYVKFALPAQQKIFSALKGKIPTINFAHNWDDIETLGQAGADIVSLPSSTTIENARKVLGDDQVVQGNFSNKLLETGTREQIAEQAAACLASGGKRGHIFNLDHGLLRTTPYENIQYLIECVKNSAN